MKFWRRDGSYREEEIDCHGLDVVTLLEEPDEPWRLDLSTPMDPGQARFARLERFKAVAMKRIDPSGRMIEQIEYHEEEICSCEDGKPCPCFTERNWRRL